MLASFFRDGGDFQVIKSFYSAKKVKPKGSVSLRTLALFLGVLGGMTKIAVILRASESRPKWSLLNRVVEVAIILSCLLSIADSMRKKKEDEKDKENVKQPYQRVHTENIWMKTFQALSKSVAFISAFADPRSDYKIVQVVAPLIGKQELSLFFAQMAILSEYVYRPVESVEAG